LIASLPEKDRNDFYESLTEEEARSLQYDWHFWARPDQKIPEGDWIKWMILAGRGWGKTRTGAETVRQWVDEGVKRIALVAETPADARDAMIEGESGLLNIFPPEKQPDYEPTKRRVTFHTGATAIVYSGYKPDQLRGPQHEKAWCDELASWKYPQDTWDNLMFGLRLGDNPQAVITTTPRPIPVIKKLVEEDDCKVTKGSTYDNRGNLTQVFFNEIVDRYEGTRKGRQEIHAEILSNVPGALWNYDLFQYVEEYPQLSRIVVGVDPATTNNSDSDETGIIVAGIGINGYGYVLDDRSLKASPNGWARQAIAGYKDASADRIVGEVNQGGDMVETIIKSHARNVPYKSVRATRGKQIRAEPIVALYEQGKIFHVGQFPSLEDQLCTWEPGKKSPDRMDALVWAFTELFKHAGSIGSVDDLASIGRARAKEASQW